jgi:hypothetical protein
MAAKVPIHCLIAILLAFYGTVLWLVFNPKTPSAYHDYFVSRASDCLEMAPEGTYAVGTVLSLAGNLTNAPSIAHHLVCGLSHREAEFTWTFGRQLRLLFVLDEPAATNLVFRLRVEQIIAANENSRQVVHVAVNSTKIDTISFGPTGGEEQVLLPVKGKARFEVALDLPGATSPLALGQGLDSRPMALAISEIVLLPTAEGTGRSHGR